VIVAVVAAWQLCFGDKPITCEAWQRVYTCDKYGCSEYGTTPQKKTVHASVLGGWQLVPDDRGILVQICMYDECEYMTAWEPMPPGAIPQVDFKPVQP
jgi:hypothetical protein